MSLLTTCPGCQSTLRVREEYAGRQITCPRCSATVAVSANAEREVMLTAEADPQVDYSTAVGQGAPAPRAPASQQYRPDDRRGPRRRSWKPCPRCQAEGAERVAWTAWGSFYGPSLLNHVRCRGCGYAYNGRSGRSNTVGIVFFSMIPFLLLVGLNVVMWFAFGRLMPWLMWILIGVQAVVVLLMVILGLVGALHGGEGGRRHDD